MANNKKHKPSYKHKHWYIRVINKESKSCPQTDIEDLIRLVNEFSQINNCADVRLTQQPDIHNRGGYCLHFDCREKDRMAIVRFLFDNGFMGVF